ncbi:NPQTN specific sortase B [Halalkalibacter hemicellulosilyticusJCM 9152]|uniref:NPQTN specific sortase B n=2 Tax=Halalkalibacter TaxID=2893056 RepID=W4QJG7_9BACI|nr:NPQTN specific sortase B [Halalkalibacter hemicellulosilyticusJCM 9152]
MNKMKKVIQRCITILCIAVFTFALYQLITIGYDYVNNRHVLAQIQDVYEVEENGLGDDRDQIQMSFDPLLEINEDIVGWITIDGTRIDYPVLQAEDNEYYLNRNYLHDETRAGSLFLDYRNDIHEEDRHTIIYGHRMRDGSMFGQLPRFLEQEFYEEHSTMMWDTLYEQYDVEIFSAYITTTDFYYIETEFHDDHHYESFLEEIQERSVIHSEVQVRSNDQIITLSTCDYQLDREEGRLVLHGKLTLRKQ